MKSKLNNQAAIENAAAVCEQDTGEVIAAGCSLDAPTVRTDVQATDRVVEMLEDEVITAGCTVDTVV